MTLIAGFEGKGESHLLWDSIITDATDVVLRNSDMKAYIAKDYGVVVAGDLVDAHEVLCIAEKSGKRLRSLKTDLDVVRFARDLTEAHTNDEPLFESIWRMPNGGIYSISADGCAVRAPHNLLVGGNVGPYMTGAFASLRKYFPGKTKRMMVQAAEAVSECSLGSSHPYRIHSW